MNINSLKIMGIFYSFRVVLLQLLNHPIFANVNNGEVDRGSNVWLAWYGRDNGFKYFLRDLVGPTSVQISVATT